MAISKNEIGFVIVGLAVVTLLGYVAFIRVNVETYPDIEIAARSGISEPIGMAPHEFVSAKNSLVPMVNMPHRYPNVSGGNLTVLINQGMTPLRKRAPADSKWIECPPAEVMF
jgi:hypothetical protein